jgi:hypothetical protein
MLDRRRHEHGRQGGLQQAQAHQKAGWGQTPKWGGEWVGRCKRHVGLISALVRDSRHARNSEANAVGVGLDGELWRQSPRLRETTLACGLPLDSAGYKYASYSSPRYKYALVL